MNKLQGISVVEELFSDFSSPWQVSDVVLLVEGRQLHAHRLVLSLQSKVFERMFHSDFKEKSQQEIKLPGKCYEEMKEMLQVVYDRRKEITDSNFEFLMALADEFQIPQIKFECIKFIKHSIEQQPSLHATIKYIDCVLTWNITELQETCLDAIKTVHFNLVSETEEYHSTCADTKLVIATSRIRHLEVKMKDYESSVSSLLKQLYFAAHKTYMEQLCDKGYEQSVLGSCEKGDEHRISKPGVKFDVSCSSCRRRVRMCKEFTVKVKDVCDLMDWLFSMEDVT